MWVFRTFDWLSVVSGSKEIAKKHKN